MSVAQRSPKPALPAPAARTPSSGTYDLGIRRVVTRPDPRLAFKSQQVDPCHPDVVALADALVTTMRASPACIGLAAPQIAIPARLFCMDLTGHPKARSCAGLVVLANPIVVRRSRDVVMREGCLSVPHLTGNVMRSAEIVVEGHEPGTGRLVRVDADAMEARCLHHLDGILFVDRVSDPRDLFERRRYA
jgi:peptide deformylase